MSKVLVVYYSSTGNTQAMAEAVGQGATAAGAEVLVTSVSDAGSVNVADYDGVALGCSAMGAEELEAAEFRPFFDAAAPLLVGKKVALFGSYGWGDGQWMRTWEEECNGLGITLACPCLIANEAPDADALAQCEELGKALA